MTTISTSATSSPTMIAMLDVAVPDVLVLPPELVSAKSTLEVVAMLLEVTKVRVEVDGRVVDVTVVVVVVTCWERYEAQTINHMR